MTEVQDVTAQPGETVNTDPAEGAVTPVTVRKYAFDKNGNRTSLTTTVNGTQTASRSWTYDAADRVGVGAGYVYDGLGRQTTIPAADAPAAAGGVKAGVGAITVSYFADDAAAAITRNGTTSTIARDPAGRRLSVTSTGTNAAGTETKHYVDDSDNPAWSSRVQGTQTITTRYESTIGGDLALTITDNTVELALSNPHGDVVATVPVTGANAGQGITGWAQYDEYGNQLSEPVSTGATNYGWHGADQRAVDTSGLILMGARLYNPVTGLFTSRDPVEGGNTTAYAYPQDPVGMSDTTGLWSWNKIWGGVKRAWNSPAGRITRRVVSAASWVVPGGAAVKVLWGVYKGYKLYKAVKKSQSGWNMITGKRRYSKFSQNIAGRLWVGRRATKHKYGEWRSRDLKRAYRPASRKSEGHYAANYQAWKRPRKSNANRQFADKGDYNYHSIWNNRRW